MVSKKTCSEANAREPGQLMPDINQKLLALTMLYETSGCTAFISRKLIYVQVALLISHANL